ncbi:protein-cysteine N-palmitoyltransferase HHAT-like protein isoform X2 [Clavelina lepadiformis]|uniref:protein-cysteine N-palmitoyltransferase HHAT-like protein isoform X2 n=1 Tax=Clavelina lepadiformis TaxID=159417 RepID=UPI00404276EC
MQNNVDSVGKRTDMHRQAGAHKSTSFWGRLNAEGKACASLLTAVAAYSVAYILRESSNQDADDVISRKKGHLGEGWGVLSRKRDIADFEWTFWFSEAKEILVSLYLGHVTIGYIASELRPEMKERCVFAFSFVSVFYIFGGSYIIMMSSLCCAYYLISKHRSITYVAVLSGSLLVLFRTVNFSKVTFLDIGVTPLAESALTYAIFRCCSFSFEAIERPSDGNDLMKLFQYNFYLPYFFFGPVLTYDCFKNQEFMQAAPSVVLGFLAFINVYLDWLKGRVLYTLTSGIARHVDGCSRVPGCAKCTVNIYTFADTFFDRGIQHWLVRYVYDPLGQTHNSFWKEALAGAASFGVVLLAQGVTWQSLAFVLLNWAGLTLEFCLIKNFNVIRNERIKAFAFGLNYWFILLFNSIGINGIQTSWVYFKKLFLEGGVTGVVVMSVIGYCYVTLNRMIKNNSKEDKKTN